MDFSAANSAIDAAIDLIARTPGYAAIARDLSSRQAKGRIRFEPALEDRAQVSLSCQILLGPEAFDGTTTGLAQTLVHEQYHLRQNPFEKTASFWQGVALRRPVMRRYEQPAYRSALRFLDTVAATFPELAADARREAFAVRAAFAAHYGGGSPD